MSDSLTKVVNRLVAEKQAWRKRQAKMPVEVKFRAVDKLRAQALKFRGLRATKAKSRNAA